MLQETRFQVQVIKPCKFVQVTSEEMLFIKARQLVSIEALGAVLARGLIASQ